MSATPRESPYLGLHSFKESDKDLFFGRDGEKQQLLQHVKRAPLTVLFGRSGLGKSSLLEAGLFPLLRDERYFPIKVRLNFTADALRPIDQVRKAITTEIEKHHFEARPPREGESLWQYFHTVEFWDERNWVHVPVLVFDQFEEAFTLGRAHPDRDESLGMLADVAENRIPDALRRGIEEGSDELPESYDRQPVRIVFSLREDHLGQLENLRGLLPSVYENRYRLTPMTGAQALEAVSKPSEGLVDETVAKAIVRFVAAAGDGHTKAETIELEKLQIEPALLSLMCDELTRMAGSPDKISNKLVQDASEDVLRDFYERGVANLGEQVRVFVEDRLLTSDGYRTTVALRDALKVPGVTEEAMDALVDRRLLRREDRLEIPHLEIIHDVLRGVIKSSRDNRLERQALAAREKARETERQRRIQRISIVTLVCAALIMGFLAREAFQEKREAERQRDLLLTANAIVRAEGQRGRVGALLARQAYLYASRRPAQAIAEVDQTLRSLLAEPLPGAILRASDRGLTSVAFSPAHGIVAVGGEDRKVTLWSTASEEPLDVLYGGPEPSLSFSRNGRMLASADKLGSIRLWDISPSKAALRHKMNEPGAVHDVAFSPDGMQLATASEDGRVRLWDLGNLDAQPRSFGAHRGAVRSLAFGLDSSTLVTGGDDQAVILWELHVSSLDKFEQRAAFHGNQAAVLSVDMSPRARLIASGGADGTVRVWNVEDPFESGLLGRHSGPVRSVIFSPDERFLASDGAAVVGARDGAKLWSLTDPDAGAFVFPPESERASFISLAFDGEGKTLAAASNAGAIELLHIPGAQRTVGVPTGQVNSLVFTRDRAWLLAGGFGGITAIDLEFDREPHFIATDGAVWLLAISPDGKTLAAGSENPAEVALWLLNDLDRQPTVLPGYENERAVYSVAFSPDGRMLATSGGNETVRLWDMEALSKKPRTLHTEQRHVPFVLFTPDGAKLVTAGADGSIRVWNRERLEKPTRVLTGHESTVVSMALDRDGSLLASGDGDGTIRLWDLEAGEERALLRGHEGAVNFLAFRPDGHILASTGSDGTARLWDLESDNLKASVLRFGDRFANALAFSPDGRNLALGLSNRVILWVARTEDLAGLVCDVVPWNLSPEEWREYLGDVPYESTCPGLPIRPVRQQTASRSGTR